MLFHTFIRIQRTRRMQMKTAAENAPVGKFSRSQVLMAQVMRTSSVTLALTLPAFVMMTFEARVSISD